MNVRFSRRERSERIAAAIRVSEPALTLTNKVTYKRWHPSSITRYRLSKDRPKARATVDRTGAIKRGRKRVLKGKGSRDQGKSVLEHTGWVTDKT